MLKFILQFLLCMMYMLMGSMDISNAVDCFKKEEWFMFGFNVMWVIFWSTLIVLMIIKMYT